MRAWHWLRGLAGLLALFTVGHTLGTASPRVTRGDPEAALFSSMQNFHFPVMGFVRSYWQFYRGFALTISLLLLVMAVIAWQLAAISRRDPKLAWPIALTLQAGCVGLLALSCVFFFGAPIVMSALAVCVAGAALAAIARDAQTMERAR